MKDQHYQFVAVSLCFCRTLDEIQSQIQHHLYVLCKLLQEKETASERRKEEIDLLMEIWQGNLLNLGQAKKKKEAEAKQKAKQKANGKTISFSLAWLHCNVQTQDSISFLKFVFQKNFPATNVERFVSLRATLLITRSVALIMERN